MPCKRILIADDDPKLLNALTVRLKANGFDVITSQDAYQALDFARRQLPDLLLLDINMPAGRGFSVQERIQNIKELEHVPVVYITGDKSDGVVRDARKLRAFAVIHKPFSTDKLLDIIQSALDWSEDRKAAA